MKTKEKLISKGKDLNEEENMKAEKPDSTVEEIILGDSDDDTSQDVIVIENEKKADKKTLTSLNQNHLLKNSELRGLFPRENDNSYLNSPVVRRCCIEHCYFFRNCLKYSLRNSPEKDHNTLQFENKNANEQQTTDVECLTSQEVNNSAVNNFFDENNVKNTRKRKRHRVSSSSGSEAQSLVDDLNDHDYFPEDNSSDSECGSVGSDAACEIIKEISKPNLNDSKSKDASESSKKLYPLTRISRSNYPKLDIPKGFVSVHDLLKKIKNMQKLVKVKYDKKTGRCPPSKLKVVESGKGEEISKVSEFMFPITNLKKLVNGEKNWKLDQSLGLDDLLLKASELNAENFTKALGRKLEPVKTNLNAKDNSEIVFTIPESKKSLTEEEKNCGNTENEFPACLKTIKIDISKPFFEPDKKKEVEKLKPAEEASVKRPGIKVKTVENINEEFKDSLGLKNNLFQDCNLTSNDKKISLPENKNSFSMFATLKTVEKDEIMQEKKNKKNKTQPLVKEGQPFVMTIIQSKAEKQRPAILRNYSYLKKIENNEKTEETINNRKLESETSLNNSGLENKQEKTHDEDPQCSKTLEKEDLNSLNSNKNENSNKTSVCDKSLCSNSKENSENEIPKLMDAENKSDLKKKNIPFILRKIQQIEGSSFLSKKAQAAVLSKLVKSNEESEKVTTADKILKVTSVEQKLGPKEPCNTRFIKVVPYEPMKPAKKLEPKLNVHNENETKKTEAKETEPKETETKETETKETECSQKLSNEVSEPVQSPVQTEEKSNNVISLSAFYTVLKEILPDKWVLCLDKKFGLQIMKIHLDKFLNPSILISVVIATCGKLTVNVRGKQLKNSHELFSNLCSITNSENKLSLNYVLAILNKLKSLSVCLGCDDPSFKKYWGEEGCIEQHTEFQEVYRSHLCHLLVSLGKKRCYPCYRINESLKMRYQKDNMEGKPTEDSGKDSAPKDVPEIVEESDESPKGRGVKRNLEVFLEESFSTMKQQIAEEIEKNKKLGERENDLKTQEEVLSFMGLTRKNSLDNPVRKSKRKKKSFFKLQQPAKKKIDQQELEFLEKYWTDINTLFSTSLLFGAYSRTGGGRLREKCRMFKKLLSTWKDIAKNNPEWIGGEIILPEELSDGDSLSKDAGADCFEKMDVPALRVYIINSVREVNRIKHKLKTKNSYFKILYNKFVKRRMKRSKPLCSPSGGEGEKKENGSSANSSTNSTTNTPTPTDFSSDESSRDKEKTTDEDNRPINDLIMTCVSDGD